GVCPESGTVFYVSTGGSDDYSCEQAQSTATPRQTINGGVGCLSPGDTLFVRGGSYDERLSNIEGHVFPSGTSWSNSILVAAYPHEIVWLRPSGAGSHAVYFGHGEHYIEFDGINVDASNVGLYVPFQLSSSVEGGDTHHIRIRNAEIIGSADQELISGGSI